MEDRDPRLEGYETPEDNYKSKQAWRSEVEKERIRAKARQLSEEERAAEVKRILTERPPDPNDFTHRTVAAIMDMFPTGFAVSNKGRIYRVTGVDGDRLIVEQSAAYLKVRKPDGV